MELAALADHGLGVVGPDAGGVDDLPGADLDLGVGLEVAHPDAGDPLALAEEAHDPGPVGAQRAVRLAVRTSAIVCRASSTCAS